MTMTKPVPMAEIKSLPEFMLMLCRVGFHKWSDWFENQISEDGLIVIQQRRCLYCKMKHKRTIINEFEPTIMTNDERQIETAESKADAVKAVFWRLMTSAHGVSDIAGLETVSKENVRAILRLVDVEVSGWYGTHATHLVLKDFYAVADIRVTSLGALKFR